MGVHPQGPSEMVKPMFKRRRRKWLYGGIAIVIVLGAGVPIALQKLHKSSTVSPGQLYTVNYGNITQTVSTSGTVEAPTEVDLNFQGNHSGLIKTLSVKIGQKVKKGQVLATIDHQTESIQVQQDQASVKQAQANLLAQQTKLQQDQTSSATPAQIASDRLSVQQAQTKLQQDQQAYKNTVASTNDKSSQLATIQSDKLAVQQAQLTLNNSDGTVKTQTEKVANDQTQLKQDQTTLQNTQTQYGTVTWAQVQQAYQNYEHEQSLSDEWNNGAYGGSNPYSTAVSTANTEYSQLDTAYKALQSAQQAVTSDQQALQSDQTALTNDKSSETQTQQQNQLALQKAQAALQTAQQQYNDPTSSQQTLDSAKNAIQNDQASIKSAQLKLQTDQEPQSAATIKSDEASVTSAQSSLENAQANLQTAQLALGETVLKAPIDGVVTQINGKIGDTVSQATGSSSTSTTGATGFIVMDDSNTKDMQVNLAVSEAQIGSVAAGQKISLTVPAYPSDSFTGTITQVYPVPTVSSNVTQYTVIATADNTSGKLRPGMSASATITTAQKTHVLTVPAVALHQVGTVEGVYVESPSTSGSGTANSSRTAVPATAGGQGNKSGAAGGSAGKSGASGSGGSSGKPGAGRSGNRGSGGGNARGHGGGSSAISAGLPSNIHFQPVKEGVIGSNQVEVTSGLQAGDQILLTLPGQTASALVAAQGSPFGGHGGGVGRALRG